MDKVCKQKNNGAQQANMVNEVENEEAETLFVATCMKAQHQEEEGWIIDSGATNHMSYKEEWFKNLDKSLYTKVKIGNGAYMEVQGKGDVVFKTDQGTKIIHNVLFVPSLCENLLSVGQMLDKGYTLNFSNKVCTIVDENGNVVMNVGMRNKNFKLSLEDYGPVALNTKVENISQLWHKRLGHSSVKTMKGTQSLVKDMPLVNEFDHVCDVCQQGKQVRLPFPHSSWKAKYKLELVHSDVCGPMSVPSLNGSRYFLTFIDDYTRWCWIYFLTQKSQVAEKFGEFKKMVENQAECKIKCIRTDNGGEYTGHCFQSICKESGIVHQFTTPYTPQQNGVCERKNRTLMEMARCLLFENNMPKKFWAEVVNTSNYIQNRSFTKSLEKKTPFELWYEFQPSLDNLRIFGSVCYMLVPSEKRGKLDKRGEVGVLMGYSEVTKGYRIFNMETQKLLISRDVVIDEISKWNWSKEEIQNKGDDALSQGEEVEGNEIHDNDDDDPFENSIEVDEENEVGVRGLRPLTEIYERVNVALCDPTSVEEAFEKKEWRQAMNDELKMIEKNETWSLVTKPRKKYAIGVKWIFRTKYNPDGSISKHKARLVVKGYAQQAGVDYGETFAPVARMETIRLLAISA